MFATAVRLPVLCGTTNSAQLHTKRAYKHAAVRVQSLKQHITERLVTRNNILRKGTSLATVQIVSFQHRSIIIDRLDLQSLFAYCQVVKSILSFAVPITLVCRVGCGLRTNTATSASHNARKAHPEGLCVGGEVLGRVDGPSPTNQDHGGSVSP